MRTYFVAEDQDSLATMSKDPYVSSCKVSSMIPRLLLSALHLDELKEKKRWRKLLFLMEERVVPTIQRASAQKGNPPVPTMRKK